MVDLSFTEWWHCGNPKEHAEYRRLKGLSAKRAYVKADNSRAEEVLKELNQHKKKKNKKKRRKRKRGSPRNPGHRLKKR